jgi:uncharacterized membrane protein
MSTTERPGREGAGGDRAGSGRRATGAWAAVAVLLGIGIVVPLCVFLYDSVTPTLWGFPFYYWFQFAMIPVVSILTFVAFQLSLVATRKDREQLGLPAEPDGSTGSTGGTGSDRGDRS